MEAVIGVGGRRGCGSPGGQGAEGKSWGWWSLRGWAQESRDPRDEGGPGMG